MRFKSTCEFNDTGLVFNSNEIKAIRNVSGYMLGQPYNSITISNDINIIINCYKKNPSKLREFDQILIWFVNEKAKEVEFFNNVMTHPNTNYFYQDMMQYATLPFRYSRNPEIDVKIISKIAFHKEPNYFNTLCYLLNETDLRKRFWFVYINSIKEKDFGKNKPKLGWFEKYPETDDKIIENFEREKNFYRRNFYINDTHAVGNYAELVLHNYLRNIHSCDEMFWVSRRIGDGFGYDLLEHNLTNNNVKLYEVKGSLSPNQENTILLSPYETEILKLAKHHNTEHHSVKLFFDKNITRMYDVCNKDGQTTLNQINGRLQGSIITDYDEKTLTYTLS